MSLDAIAKKYFAVWICGLVGTAAYFQASGVGSIVVASMSHGPSEAAPPSRRRGKRAPHRAEKSAAPILARNAFDSVTGPLDGKAWTPGPDSGEPPPVRNGNDPYEDPPCAGVKVSLVTASDDPEWSFASLSHEGKSELRRKGDKVGDAQVINIGWYASDGPNAQDPTPRVWLNEGGSRCMVAWGGAEEGPKKPAPAPKTKGPKPKGKVPPELEAKIHKKSDTEYDVERSAVQEIIKNYAQLAAGLHARATKEGVRLSGIRSTSILTSLGMKNGDILHSINGYDMSDQDKALEAYAKLKSAKSLSIQIERGGTPMTIAIGIQ
jgi:general secretion pathway protein C